MKRREKWLRRNEGHKRMRCRICGGKLPKERRGVVGAVCDRCLETVQMIGGVK